MLTKILLGAIAVLVLGLIVSGTLLKTAWKDVARLEQLYSAQQAETAKAIAQIADIKLQHQQQIHAMDNHLKDRQRDITALKRKTQVIRQSQDKVEKALKREPVRTRRVLNYLYSRRMREVCRSSGGSVRDCKITIPKSSNAKPNNPAKSKLGGAPNR